MTRRSLETLTDVLVLIVSPVLVMILVASLAFFLIQCFYDGQFFGRLNFATAMFVMAAVLVARIAIEEGREYASTFSLPLGVVTILSILQYTDIGPLVAIPMVLFIWWSTDKLTWDCTVLDEQKDASGEGLLQTIGFDEKAGGEIDERATTDGTAAEATSLWQQWLDRRRRHHTPGVWVIYFGLAAIPLFGIGQSVLPRQSLGAGFLLLCTYVASALALLMITSFLQMRRYLIQRRLPFTEKMAATWLGTGGVLIMGLMLVCLLLPRPNTGYSIVDSLSASMKKASSHEDRKASDLGRGKEGVRDDEKDGSGDSNEDEAESESEQGRQASTQAKQGKQQGKRGKGGEQKTQSGEGDDGEQKTQSGEGDDGEQKTQSGEGDDGEQSEGKQGEGDSDDDESSHSDESNQGSDESERSKQPQQQSKEGREDEPTDSQQQSQSSRPKLKPPLPNPLKNISLPSIPKVIYILLVSIGVLAVLYFFGRQIFGAVASFLRELAALFRRLFGGMATEAAEVEEDVAQVVPPRPFASFKDPFATGMASRLNPQQLVAYTFEALQAWALEQQCPRQEDQTPLEFAGQISDKDRAVGLHARNLAVLYNQAAYAPTTLGANAVEHVQGLWKAMRR